MALSNVPVLVQTPKIGLVQCVNADGTNPKTVVTPGTNGSKVTSLTVASNDTASRTFNIFITRSAANYLIGSVTVPAGSGNDGSTPSVNALTSALIPGLPVDNDGQPYLFLQQNDALVVALTTSSVTTAKTVSFAAVYGDF